MTATVKWVAEELCFSDLGNPRRNRRLVCSVKDLAAQPSASAPQASTLSIFKCRVSIVRTELSGYDAVGVKALVVGMRFNRSWV